MNKEKHHSQRGIGRITLIFFGTLTTVAVFCGYQILPFYYYHYELLNQLESLTRVAGVETDQSIRKKLDYHLKKMQIPADISDVRINREGNTIHISLMYKEIFYIKYRGKVYDLYVFPFHAEAVGSF